MVSCTPVLAGRKIGDITQSPFLGGGGGLADRGGMPF